MNEAKIDHLLQVTAPRASWLGLTPVAGRGEHPAFDDHLVYATAPPALAEASRPRGTRPLENSPPTESLPWQREVTPSDVEENDNNVAAQNTSNRDRDDESLASDETEASATGSVASEPDAAKLEAEPCEVDDPHNVETDEHGEELAADVAAATDSAAKPVVVSKSLAWHKKDTEGTAAAPPVHGDPAQPITKQSKLTLGRHTGDGLQPVTLVETSASADNVVQADASAAQSDSESAASTAVGTRIQAEPGTEQRTADVASPSLPAIGTLRAKGTVDHPTAVSKRHRPPVGESEPAVEHTAATNSDENQKSNALPTIERQGSDTEQKSDEPRGTEAARLTSGRQSVWSESLNSKLNNPVVAAIQSAAVDTVVETTKPESSDEPVHATPQSAPRSDALVNPLARLHRGGTTIARIQGDAKSEEAPQVDASRFVSRVAKAFHTAQERGGTLQLRLSPPELGALRLELLVHDGVLAAKLEAETPAARRALLDHLPALRDRLAEQNIRIERFDVDVRQEGSGHSPSSPQHGRHSNHPHQDSTHRQPPRQPVPSPESATPTQTAASPITDTQINLVA